MSTNATRASRKQPELLDGERGNAEISKRYASGVDLIDPALLKRAQQGDPQAVEQVLGTIVAGAKQERARWPRWLWIVAGILGGVCAIALVVAVLATPAASGSGVAPREPSAGGFGSGLAIGLAVGIGLGWALARGYRHSSRSSP